MLRPRRSLLLAALFAVATAGPALADERRFAFTYPTETLDQGEREFALWTNVPRAGDIGNRLEMEYGVTDRFSLALYGNVAALQRFDSASVEARYRLTDPGQFPLDAALYLEADSLMSSEPVEFEGKLLLGKTLGPVELDANLIAEKKLANEPTEFNLAAGASYAVLDWLKVGAETRLDAGTWSVGPAIAAGWAGSRAVLGVQVSATDTLSRLMLSQEF